jgi:hypothetical protein
MKGTTKSGLTRRKAAAFILVTLLASVFLGIGLASRRIYLIPSLFRFTSLFYAMLGLLPALIVLVICIRKHPGGNRLWFILVPLGGRTQITRIFKRFFRALPPKDPSNPCTESRQLLESLNSIILFCCLFDKIDTLPLV